MTVAEQLLKSLVNALDSAFISSWQKELDAAREHLKEIRERK